MCSRQSSALGIGRSESAHLFASFFMCCQISSLKVISVSRRWTLLDTEKIPSLIHVPPTILIGWHQHRGFLVVLSAAKSLDLGGNP